MKDKLQSSVPSGDQIKLTNDPSLPKTLLVFVADDIPPWKPLSPEITGKVFTTGPETAFYK